MAFDQRLKFEQMGKVPKLEYLASELKGLQQQFAERENQVRNIVGDSDGDEILGIFVAKYKEVAVGLQEQNDTLLVRSPLPLWDYTNPDNGLSREERVEYLKKELVDESVEEVFGLFENESGENRDKGARGVIKLLLMGMHPNDVKRELDSRKIQHLTRDKDLLSKVLDEAVRVRKEMGETNVDERGLMVFMGMSLHFNTRIKNAGLGDFEVAYGEHNQLMKKFFRDKAGGVFVGDKGECDQLNGGKAYQWFLETYEKALFEMFLDGETVFDRHLTYLMMEKSNLRGEPPPKDPRFDFKEMTRSKILEDVVRKGVTWNGLVDMIFMLSMGVPTDEIAAHAKAVGIDVYDEKYDVMSKLFNHAKEVEERVRRKIYGDEYVDVAGEITHLMKKKAGVEIV